jgi:hypothetical protein
LPATPNRAKNHGSLQTDRLAEKLLDIVGFYMNPLEHALVLYVGEKSQIQALDRTPAGLPLTRDRRQMTHDYKRSGTARVCGLCQETDTAILELAGIPFGTMPNPRNMPNVASAC